MEDNWKCGINWKRKKPQFKEWTKQQSKVSLTNYLILPVQRIPRYEILLQSLLRYTDKDHADHKNILAALKKVEELNVLADAKKKEEDNRKTLTEIQQSVSGGPSLLVAHRFFLKEGLLDVVFPNKKKEEKLYAFLFSDILLLTRQKKGGKVADKRPKAKFRHVISFKDGCSLEKPDPKSLKIIDNANQRVYAISPAEVAPGNTIEAWNASINQALQDKGWRKILY